MPKSNKTVKHNATAIVPVTIDNVREKIVEVRGQYVILDRDVAHLYGVETRIVNQAVKMNPHKFPKGYVFVLDNQEFVDLLSKILIANPELNSEINKVRYTPVAFTERGLYMLATILKSEQAVATTIAIIDTFTSVKTLTRTIRALNQTEDKAVQKGLLKRTGELLGDILGDDMATDDTETEFELNFAVLKVKHTVKRKKNSKDKNNTKDK